MPAAWSARLVFLEQVERAGEIHRLDRQPGLEIDDAIEQRAKLGLEHGRLQADHRAAPHLRLEADFTHRLDHADGVERIRADHQQVRIQRLDRAHNRREIGRGRRIGLFVDDLESRCLRILMRAFAGVAAEFCVRHRNRDRLRLWLLHLRHLEEAAREGGLRCRAVRNHREIFRIVESLVHAGAEQAHEQLLFLDGDRHRRSDLGRGIAAHDQVNFVDIEQLGVDAGHLRRIALIVVVDELNRPAEQPAFGIDVVFPDLHGDQRHFAVGREGTGQRHAKADFDWLGRLGRRRRQQ